MDNTKKKSKQTKKPKGKVKMIMVYGFNRKYVKEEYADRGLAKSYSGHLEKTTADPSERMTWFIESKKNKRLQFYKGARPRKGHANGG